MIEPAFHLAQVNMGRARGEMTEPVMAGFVARLEEINALADLSPVSRRRMAMRPPCGRMPTRGS